MNSGDIVKLQLEERIRFLLLRFPNNFDRVAQEVSLQVGAEVPTEYVVRAYKKFRKQQEKDVRFWISCNMAQEILLGARQRQAKLETIYEHWDGLEELVVSSCHEYPVEKHTTVEGQTYTRCLQCDNTCKTRTIHRMEVEGLKIRLVKELRQESNHLMKFAKDMGFTTKPDVPPPDNTTNFVIVQGEQKQTRPEAIAIDATTADKVSDMDPMDREKLKHKLKAMLDEAKTADAEFVKPAEESPGA